jgi:hypothetical protein
MKIIQIEIINNRKVKCFKVRLDGKNMTVAGDTGTGKTTAVSAFWDILEKCQDSITHGQSKGLIRVKLSDGSKVINAVRRNTKNMSTVRITDSEGDTIKMSDFKKLISDLAVNPHKIIDMKPAEQLRTLAAAADLGDVDLAGMDAEEKTLEEERLALYRLMSSLSPGDEPEDVKAVDVSALAQELNRANESNAYRANLQNEVESINSTRAEESKSIEALEAQIERIKARNEGRVKKVVELTTELDKTEEVPTAELIARIETAQETNAKANDHAGWLEKKKLHDAKVEAHAAVDGKIKEIREAKQAALDGAKWPLDGLAIEDGNILYKNCLLSNLGTSEQLLVCSALAINEIISRPVKVVRLDGVESMSREDFAALTKLFNGKGVQVLSTRVTWGGTEPEEIVIVDGEYTEDEK